jgi:hypothetical protein
MAYKFQLGPARMSGSLVQEDNVAVEGNLEVADSGQIGCASDADLMVLAAQSVAFASDADVNIAKAGGFQIAGSAVTATAAEINIMDGVTATTAEINYLDNDDLEAADMQKLADLTATAAELNIMDGVTASTAEINIMDGVTASTAELNIMDGVTATTAELNYLDNDDLAAADIQKLADINSSAAELNALSGFGPESIDVSADSIVFYDPTNTALRLTNFNAYAAAIAGDALAADGSGALDLQISGALAISGDKLGVSGSIAGDGLGYDGGGESVSALKVNVDDSSVEISSDALRVKALGVTNAMLAGSIVNSKLVNDSITLTAGAGMAAIGEVDLGASITVAVDGVLEDLDSLGAASADGEFIVATGAGAFAYESGNTARTSLGLGTGDSPQFTNLTLSGDLTVNGAATTISTTNLEVEDNLILLGSGSQGAGHANDLGLVFRTGNDQKDHGFIYDQSVERFAMIKEGLNSDLIDASATGDLTFGGYADLQVNKLIADSIEAVVVEGIQTFSASGNIDAGSSIVIATRQGSDITLTLPAASGNSGKIFKVKVKGTAAGNVVIDGNGSETIDAEASITLESQQAAVSLVCDGSEWYVM